MTMKRGDAQRLYISDDFEAINSAMLHVKHAQDIDYDYKRGSDKSFVRGDEHQYQETLKLEESIKFGYRPRKKGLDDAVLDLLLTAMAANTPLFVKLLDGPIGTVGSKGIKGAFKVMDASSKNPANGASEMSFELVPVFHAWDDSGTDVEVPITSETIAS